MADPQEITALKASFRGALGTAEALAALTTRIEALGPTDEPSPADLEDLARITAAHATASAALRGFVGTMIARRSGDAM
jgi:hypothetical protein